MRALIVIDMQNDFITGSLGFPNANIVLQNVKSKLQSSQINNVDIYFTRDRHNENYLNTREGKMLPIPHCITEQGYSIHDDLLPYTKTATVFDKSDFCSSDLIQTLIEKQYSEIEICGLVTDICVISHALAIRSALPESKITIDSQSVGSDDIEAHNSALKVMKRCQIEIINQ